MDSAHLLPVHGFVLAGGKSSRMGRDKALLELAGKPLVEHAVSKLRRICEQVSVLGEGPELEAYGPVVRDVHPGCGPIGGIEAALLHSKYEWNLILPVDVPFLPTAFLNFFARSTMEGRGARLGMYEVDGVPQPTLLTAHRDVLPYLSVAVERGAYKLYPVLQSAAQGLNARLGLLLPHLALRLYAWGAESRFETAPSEPRGPVWEVLTEAQQRAKQLWFANLNTPLEFAEAERHVDALDT